MKSVLFVLRDVNLGLPALLGEVYAQLVAYVLAGATQMINEQLEAHVNAWLGRADYVRRKRVSGSGLLRCRKCGSRWRAQFSRNGYRERGLDLVIGRLRIALPRVRCVCGGSVDLNLPDLRPRQRLGGDWAALIEHWSSLGYSRRQIKAELDNGLQSSLGLRSISERLHALARRLPQWRIATVPPVVMVDAIWVRLMQPSDERRSDRQGRRRVVKRRVKVPVLVALGVWPEQGRSQVLDWEVGTEQGEDRASWLRLLNRLEERGLRPENGLKLWVHDGGAGLIAALNELFPDVPHQRCVFHKLRNLLRAIVPPEELPKEARRNYCRRLIRQAAQIWQAPTREEALRRYARFRRRWQDEQPEVIATLDRDFEATLTFYQVWNQNRLWPMHYLRSISHLERLNRRVRFRTHKAGVYHSLTGLQAMLVQVFASL